MGFKHNGYFYIFKFVSLKKKNKKKVKKSQIISCNLYNYNNTYIIIII